MKAKRLDSMDHLKSMLHRSRRLNQWVQRLRDQQLHKRAAAKGSFAQHGEDLLLLELLRELGATGPYVDIGCNHPFRLSNTYLLYRNGYRGVCVDPLPHYRDLHQRWRPGDQMFSAAVGVRRGRIELHEFEWDPLSTLDETLANEYIRQGFRRLDKYDVDIRTVDDILENARIDEPISLMSIDIEGHELAALQSTSLQRWQPAVICIEAMTADGERNQAPLQHLLGNGYRLHGDTGLNAVFIRAGLA